MAERDIAVTRGGWRREEAARLAREHRDALARGRGTLRPRLRSLERSLEATYRDVAARRPITEERGAAAEWLLDNQHVVRDALEQVREGLPAGFYRTLPVVTSGPWAGKPRLDSLVRKVLDDAGRPVELEIAEPFLESYQEVAPLSIGELWAFPALLRLVVLEDLAATAAEVAGRAEEKARARTGEGGELAWAILALRDLASLDWRAFFERTSRVERILRQDPAGAYPEMSFATRDSYRKAVETLARWAPGGDEEAVARQAAELAREAAGEAPSPVRAAHVGTYLVAEGRRRLESLLGCRVPRRVRLARRLAGRATGLYLSAVGAAWAAALAVPGYWLATRGVTGWGLGLGLFFASGPALGLAVAIVNWLSTLLFPPRVLPRMDPDGEMPAAGRTLVAVPVIVSRVDEVKALLARLELHFLGNRDPALTFALLIDLADAPERTMPDDEALLAAARDGIRRLERRYGEPGHQAFHLFHRERLWNPVEGTWMCWERKRGKLEELNRLLLGSRETSFVEPADPPEDLRDVRYVITLDADTRLPPGAAAELVATFIHPLNRPVVDPGTGDLVAGYTVLQPRLAVEPSAANASRFTRILAGESGLDLYTRAVSDVYQDLFGEAVFAGKGIYDVAAFERRLRGRVPENRLLSHDLFEGVHGRVGLVSETVLFEDYPTNELLHARRLHRWVRGDWQLLLWLLPRVPAAVGGRIASGLSLLDRWKIVDNLRRSLFLPSVGGLFVVAWLALPPAAAAVATAGIAALLGVPIALGALGEVRRGVAGRAWRPAVEAATHGLRIEAARWLLTLVSLAHQSLVVLDAVGRTLYRLTVSRRRLLEWTTAAQAARGSGGRLTPARAWRGMVGAPVLAVGLAALLAAAAPGSLPAAAPLLLLWLLSPQVAVWTSRPVRRARRELTEAERRELRLVARRTWRFFEELVGPADHWLPPDHYQEEPGGMVARRTSPTNVAMLLLATLAAHDLGYLGLRALAERVRETLGSLDALERHRGHWLNWYDTRSLTPLEPRYVSTVDSGNLAAALLVLGRGLWQLAARTGSPPRREDGLADTVGVLRRIVVAGLVRPAAGAEQRDARAVAESLGSIERALRRAAGEPEVEGRELLEGVELRLGETSEALVSILESGAHEAGVVADLRAWLDHALFEARAVRLEVAEAGKPGPDPELAKDLRWLSRRASRVAREMDFAFLYDAERDLFRIGHHVSTGEPDPNHYDLLASEARVASFLAIVQGDAPMEHWLHLGRPVVRIRGSRVLLSWGATLFEYLMPSLVLRCPERTLLEESCRVAVARQVAFARRHGIPWGISESGFAELGIHGDYQYRAFGVPGLGLKRDLGDRLVVAPYASVLALPVAPRQVLENLARLVELGGLGRYGFFEAVDFGPPGGATSRQPRVVRSYMAHHQGMILAAAANLLLEEIMVERMHSDPRVASYELLLYEQVPRGEPARAPWGRSEAAAAEPGTPDELSSAVSWEVPAQERGRRLVPLSNGVYTVLLSAGGGGVSRWGDVALTRHRSDPPAAASGTWIYLKDLDSGELWSPTQEPTGGDPGEHAVVFTPYSATFRRRHGGLLARVEVAVADRVHAEIRRLVLVNEDAVPRRLFVASFAEVVLGSDEEDRRHPAFSKLFVESEHRPDGRGGGALLFRRRLRSPEERGAVLGHSLVAGWRPAPKLSWETDRGRFLGRGRDRRAPLALDDPLRGFTGTTGATLDPVMSMGCALELGPGESAELVFLTAAGSSEEQVLRSLASLSSPRRIAWAFERAIARSDADLRELGVPAQAVPELARVLSTLLAPREGLRQGLREAGTVEPVLWGQGISGDLPIVLLRVTEPDDLTLARQLLRGHVWWRSYRIGVDLVLLDEVSQGYDRPLRDRLERAAAEIGRRARLRGAGRVFVVAADALGAGKKELLAAARAVFETGAGSLAEQLGRGDVRATVLPGFVPVPGPRPRAAEVAPLARPSGLLLDNGLGGFPADRSSGGYTLFLEPGRRPPAPWVNVIANPGFGFLVSESGASCTWAGSSGAGNSGEARLTPWSNDPVTDATGEALYLRDEETAEVWTPTPAPAPGPGPHEVHHAPGRTRFRHRGHGLEQELELFVDPDAPVKLAVLRLRDLWQRPRRITATFYAEWVLGPTRERTAPFLVPELDPEAGAVLVRTLAGPLAGKGTAFLAASRPIHGLTTDRAEWLGPDGDPARPAGLRRIGLSGAVRPGLDPCTALQVHLDIPPGEEAEVVFLLGMGRDRKNALELVRRFRSPDEARAASGRVSDLWDRTLGAITVETPDPGLDRMLGGWLPYQAVACRLWARTAFYQSSGAYGFRDQLQDAANLAPLAPELAREQIVRAAAHQFKEGDVLHWWHPGPGPEPGVRTRCSDDLLWLPWACARYLAVTGDASVLDQRVPYLAAPELSEEEVERYDSYAAGGWEGSVYEHCLRAIERGSTRGPRGLPLIGGGDWNDGMNRLGLRGRGESVWLGWFLSTVLRDFAPLCEARGDTARAALYRDRARELGAALEEHAWDGSWYRRAFDDDGRPVGSAEGEECRIDLIAQAWAVLSGAASPERAATAMASAREHLLHRDDGLLLLLAPPFDRSDPSPGYIQAYPPGIRENGGQYTHGAVWGAWAFAELGDGDLAVELLRMLLPLSRTATAEGVELYRVEPYAAAADVYGVPPHTGRGGWTWYTGAAAWLWRYGIERVLGLRRRADTLEIDPCIARSWPGFRAELRHGDAVYEIRVENPDGVCRGVRSIELDGQRLETPAVPLTDDGRRHRVVAVLGG